MVPIRSLPCWSTGAMRPPPPLKRIEELRRELVRAQEHTEGDYLGERLAEMGRDATDVGEWRRAVWVNVASLGGVCAIDAEFRLLNADYSGWRLLEQSARYWTWVISKYPDEFFLKQAVVALIEATWIDRREWGRPLFELMNASVSMGSDAPGHLLWSDSHADIARFALSVCSSAMNVPDRWSGHDNGAWGQVLSLLSRGETRAAFDAACAEHFQVASDAGRSEVFARGARLLAPEIRLLTAICEAKGHIVDRSWHPLLSLPFYPFQPGGYREEADPVMALMHRHHDALDACT
jgi:hypothetical protein